VKISIDKDVAQKMGTIDILFATAGIVETVDTSAATAEHFDWRMMSCGVRQIRQ
jgi:NADP-dependent 3-hydroxy acid dehydrogenase YdfG